MDSLENFTRRLEQEFEDLPEGTLNGNTEFRKIPNWSSMHALIIIAMVDTEYDVRLTGEDIRKCNTVTDIYNIVKSRKA